MPEPFFKPDEWKALAIFRPREWRDWWTTEPPVSKIVVGCLVALGAVGLFDVARGYTGIGWFLVAAVAGLALILFVLYPLFYLPIATVRWVFRVTGIAAWWKKSGENVIAFGKFLFWLAITGVILNALWPYLSTDTTRSWYALTNKVPVERVTVEKMPHDCEFETAPLGSKHCHYAAEVIVLQGADTPDGKKSIVVSYEKVED